MRYPNGRKWDITHASPQASPPPRQDGGANKLPGSFEPSPRGSNPAGADRVSPRFDRAGFFVGRARVHGLRGSWTLAISPDFEKDWSDILVKAHQLTLDDPEFSATILKHGGEAALKRIQASILGGN